MDLGLRGRIALITGSSQGLGKAIAEAFAFEGAEIVINGRNKDKLNKVALEIGTKAEVNIHNCCVDATLPGAINRFFQENSRWFNKLDILVNNVGNIEKFGSFETLTESDWFKSLDLTFMSAVRFTKAALPLLKGSDGARIINICSLPAHQPGLFNPHYSVAKAALLNLTKYLANTLAKDGILVNAVCPSTLLGGGWHENIIRRAERDKITATEAEKRMMKEERAKSPMGKIGKLEDVANLVVFLASNKANFLTGHSYNVDGGITRSIL